VPSIYQRVLGSAFARLHPRVQEWFGYTIADGVAPRGRGTIDSIRHGGLYALPFLHVGAMRNIMFPEQGDNVPFTVESYAYLDDHGVETVAFLRTFELPWRQRRFDEYMVATDIPGRMVNYLGTHQHLAVDLDFTVGPRGDMRIRSSTQRIDEGPIRFRFPRLFSADADVSVAYDDANRCYRIDATAGNPILGNVFSYHGTFQVEWNKVTPEQIRERVMPMRLRRQR
jgi:hypothetical protein